MEYIRKIREFLRDPKKKALTQLGLYALFFIFVFLLISSAESNNYTPIVEENKTPIETYADMASYNYKITYTNIDRIDIIEGAYYNNTSLFTYNNLKYYYEDSLYIIDNNSYYLSNIEYNISKIFNKNLYTIFNDIMEESKTTYKDGMIITNYTIDSNKIYSYLYDSEVAYTNVVNISVTEKDGIITNIVLDLTNLGLSLNKIEVEYSNIDNIESLGFNKNNYTYEENL